MTIRVLVVRVRLRLPTAICVEMGFLLLKLNSAILGKWMRMRKFQKGNGPGDALNVLLRISIFVMISRLLLVMFLLLQLRI